MAQLPPPKNNANQPWAVTDALLDILAQNLIKTHRQYLEITGTYPAALAGRNQHLEFSSAPGDASATNNGLRAIAPRPSLGPFEQVSGETFQTSLKTENEPRGQKGLVASPFFEDHGSTTSYPNKNSGNTATSGPQASPPLTDHLPSMEHLDDLSFPEADYADEHVHESEFEAAVPIDPNLAYRGFEPVSQSYQGDGHASASGPSEAIDPALMMLNRHAQVGHPFYDHAGDERVFFASPTNDPSPGMRMAVTPGMHKKRLTTSPFFTHSGCTETSQLRQIRPLPGTVSCIEFPTLEADRFGIIQEELADDPFRLLIAVTFLIKTKGTAAIPAFHRVTRRFPTQRDLADAANTNMLVDMIRHLGLSERRAKTIQRIAREWLDRPPTRFARYQVRNYVRRDLDMNDAELQHDNTTLSPTAAMTDSTSCDVDLWEIGHLTQGRYALDSWRIFCRDVLLEKALDWKGTGAQDTFQPEWMRVLPQDKELRAFLRWMWMKEGWEWDPKTGEKIPLRPEMWKATREKRVSWDHEGSLVIR